jgi:imidazolonepropionase-like amidohydrolase
MRVPFNEDGSSKLLFRPAPTVERELAPTDDKFIGLKAGILIPGRGGPIENGALVIDGSKIAWVGQQSAIPAQYANVGFKYVPVLMPGLWDSHTHFQGLDAEEDDPMSSIFGSVAMAGACAAKELEAVLMAGFTTVRELGGLAGDISPAIDKDILVGPNVFSSIGLLGITGGHSDVHDIPIEAVIDIKRRGLPSQVCDGVTDCIQTVRMMVRRGAKVIKVCATGGVGSLLDDPEDVQFSPEELKAIVDEAARTKRIVAAHCHGKEGIMNALNAGVKTIEHGSYLDEEAAALMKEKDAIFVSTRAVVIGGLNNPQFFPPTSYKKLQKISEVSKKAYELAIKFGVKVVLGTDFISGENGKELVYAVEAGMTPLQAIEASTALSPETLGSHFAPLSGQLKEGYDADIIAVSSNPLENIKILAEPKNVTHVWKGGKLYKKP